MKRLMGLVCLILWSLPLMAGVTEKRAQAQKLFDDKNWLESYELYSKLAVTKKNVEAHCDLDQAVECLNRLRKIKRFDKLVEDAVKAHGKNVDVLHKAAVLYRNVIHDGYVIDDKFERDNQWRSRAKRVSVAEKDRIRSIQLSYQAMKLAEKNEDRVIFKRVCSDFANTFRFNRWNNWRMQLLTDFTVTPDYDEYQHENVDGAAVDGDGNPVFYYLPKSFENAKNDGERWRWLISQQGDKGKARLADLMRELFGVQTMQSYRHYFSRNLQDDDKRKGIMAVHTLSDDETVAKLANGVKRFKLPDEFNYIKIYNETEQYSVLAEIYENRRQYPRAAKFWRKFLEKSPSKWAKERLQQIVDNWCNLANSYGSQPAGQGAKVDLRYRNGDKVSFTARRVDYKALMKAHKKYLKLNKRDDWRRMNFYNLGQELIEGWTKEFVKEKVASWDVDLEPLVDHFDKTEIITTPLTKAGLYLVKAKMNDGNESSVLVWIDDTVIVRKDVENAILFLVTDAVSGKPVPKATVEFFGYKDHWKDSKRKRDFRSFAEYTDENGQIVLNDKSLERYRLTAIVNDMNRYAVLQNQYFYSRQNKQQKLDAQKTFIITDRPVYRPNQSVKFKAWTRQIRYDLKGEKSIWADKDYYVEVRNPRNETVFKTTLKSDFYGGIAGEFELDEEASLGRYQIIMRIYRKDGGWLGSHSFRVEEYKKPEFEVRVEAPKEPLKLGDKFTAKVKANYYFGAPVTEAEVKVKVMRYRHDVEWFPIDPWDWCFGNGYWWFGQNYEWYPGWARWGCRCPVWPWFYRPRPQPELVANLKGHVDENGEFKVTIDSALAKEIYGDRDHRYEVTAEVRDQSRRTIVGKGSVIAAREPFKVYAWTDRGYYHVGETVHASFKAQTVDFKPVDGKAEVKLFKISYNKKGKTKEKEIKSWQIETDEYGNAALKLKASTAGQFRLSCKVTDSKGNTIEGAHIFTVRGKGFDGRDYRFNHVELIADKKNYAPGEKVKLVVNTEQPDSTVFLFVRAQDSLSPMPQVLKLDGKTATVEVEVTQADMPNFFIEAMTVVNAKVHTAVRQIVVPPQKRILNVDVQPSGEKFKPGEKAKVKLRLTDINGKPFQGTMALTVYDKSLEYIAASAIPDIKEFFWKWKRHYSSRVVSSLAGPEWEVGLRNLIGMRFIGVFGDVAAPEGKARSGLAAARGVRKTKSIGLKNEVAFALEAADSLDEDFEEEESFSKDKAVGTKAETVAVRSKFADTAFWKATINTDKNGEAEVEFPMPENLTTWKIKTWGVGHGSKVGSGEAEVITSNDFIIRLQAPRFFVEKDEVVLSANIHNYLKTDQPVEAILELVGGCLEPMDKLTRKVTVKANGEIRVDWRVKAVKEGEITIRMKAIAKDDADAMEMKFPVYVHGFDKMVPFCGLIRPEGNEVSFELDVPKERRVDQSSLQVNFSPSLAMAMIDALPYLMEYPYGCTEQTLNRFLPVVITNKLLQDMEINLAVLKDKHANLNAQELGDPDERRQQWMRSRKSDFTPVFDNDEVLKMTKAGVERLASFQNSDGGWGWFGGDSSYPHTTAVVVRGLLLAKENGAAVVPNVLQRGLAWLMVYQKRQLALRKNYEVWAENKKKRIEYKRYTDNIDALIASILAGRAGGVTNEMDHFLYKDRGELSVYGKTLAALAFLKSGDEKKTAMMERNIRQFLKYDEENQTAYLEMGHRWYWWFWYGSEIEANAAFLKLLSHTAPKDKVTSGLVKYLLNNRKHATYWNSTRDTALCIEAFADYIKATGEDKPDMTVEVLLDGKVMKDVKINAENLFVADNTLRLVGKEVTSGKHKLTLRKKGTGPLYTNAYLSYFSLEDFITKAGLEVKVERRYYRLIEREKASHSAGSRGQVVGKKLMKYDREQLKSLDEVVSGDLVEVELIVESKNDYEYIMIEDMKAAGFEPVEVRSGYNGNPLGAYVEYRDEKVCFFTRWLPRGKHSVTYRLRAEVPGKFSALPTKISAMYAPELCGNSDEIKLKIKDK